MIFIITNKEDSHPTPVIEYLNEKQIPVFRLNTESLLTDYDFSWWSNDSGTDFYLKNIKNSLQIKGSEISSIWERRPIIPNELYIKNTDEIDKHNLEEARGFLSFLTYYLKDIFSIGSAIYDRVSASKMLQLNIAKKLKMKIPDTCFSNRKDKIMLFANKYDYVSLKSIYSDGFLIGDEFEYLFYSRKVKSSDLESQPEEAFSQTVNFVQEYIEKNFELRITVICNEVFTCKIDSQQMESGKGKEDWRQGYDYGLKHEVFDLPEDISIFCKEYLKKMNLNFGCFDFIVTTKGEYVFLECNPNGQWLWIELQTGLKISESIAKALMRENI